MDFFKTPGASLVGPDRFKFGECLCNYVWAVAALTMNVTVKAATVKIDVVTITSVLVASPTGTAVITISATVATVACVVARSHCI